MIYIFKICYVYIWIILFIFLDIRFVITLTCMAYVIMIDVESTFIFHRSVIYIISIIRLNIFIRRVKLIWRLVVNNISIHLINIQIISRFVWLELRLFSIEIIDATIVEIQVWNGRNWSIIHMIDVVRVVRLNDWQRIVIKMFLVDISFICRLVVVKIHCIKGEFLVVRFRNRVVINIVIGKWLAHFANIIIIIVVIIIIMIR